MATMTVTRTTPSLHSQSFEDHIKEREVSSTYCQRCYLSYPYKSVGNLDRTNAESARPSNCKVDKPIEIITPIGESPGYVSLSSLERKRRDSLDSYSSNSGSIPTAKPEPDFLSSRFNPFSDFITRKHSPSRLSLAEEAIPSDTEDSEEARDEDTKPTILTALSNISKPFSKISLPKLPERSWFCKTCRRPKDQCRCLCVIS